MQPHVYTSPETRRLGELTYLPPPWMRAGWRQPPGQQGWGPLSPGHARVPVSARIPPGVGHGPHAGVAWPCWLGSGSCVTLWFDSGCSRPRGANAAQGHWVHMRSAGAQSTSKEESWQHMTMTSSQHPCTTCAGEPVTNLGSHLLRV